MELLACETWALLPSGAVQCEGFTQLLSLESLQAALDQANTPFTLSLLDLGELSWAFTQGFAAMATAELIGLVFASILNFLLKGR
jgi:hypothetical protein